VLKPGATLVGLFGADAAKITVGHILRMESGVQDFDQPKYDELILENESHMRHSPLEFVEFAANQTVKLMFEPGTQVSYSSTNYILAGFILLGACVPTADASCPTWDTLDLTTFFPSGVLGGLRFYKDEPISDYLTVPGATGGGFGHLPKLAIYNQSSTILGWTCGNIVGTAGDVANFVWDLLGPTPAVVGAPQVDQMEVFKPLSVGWAKGFISYGAGLMIETSTGTAKLPPTLTQVGTYMGHGGDTYGFLSEQGIAYVFALRFVFFCTCTFLWIVPCASIFFFFFLFRSKLRRLLARSMCGP
jgi:CubicO group peptidase (beta-lactamase class C family)